MVLVLGVIVLAFGVIAFTSPTGGGPVEIQISTDKLSYAPDEQVHFSIYINNPHDWRVPYPLSISYQIGTFSEGKILLDARLFSPHSRTLLDTYSWSMRQPGNYTLTITLRGEVDYGKPANYTVNIKPIQ
jgi:hypothetical protein